jgi:hypothetical protein
MRSQPLPINQSELDDISAAEKAIAEICRKYNVAVLGTYEVYSEDCDWDNPLTRQTNNICVMSDKYEKRMRAHEQETKDRAEAHEKLDTQRLLDAMMEEYPNTRGLKLVEREWDMPTYFGHGPWRTTSIFIEGLVVKNWKLIKKSPFHWNPNKYWQYTKSKRDDRIRSSVSLSAYPGTDCPVIFSHPGDVKNGIYAAGSDMSDIQSQAFVVQMVDELIASGALELKGA